MFSNSTNHRETSPTIDDTYTNKPMSSVVSNATFCSVQLLLGDATSII